MPSGVTHDRRGSVNESGPVYESVLEKRGLKIEAGAPVAGAVAAGDVIVVTCGDGTVHFYSPAGQNCLQHAHFAQRRC